MANKTAFSTLSTLYRVWPSLFILLLAGVAQAQTSPPSYAFLLASGFLCDPDASGSCPAVAKSANGETYEISGAGVFDPQNRSVKAAGTFNHKAPNGTVLESGVWIANDLISFESYRVGLTALLPKGPALSRVPNAPKGPPKGVGVSPTGGLAVLRILLMTVSGARKPAILQANCPLGDVPRDHSAEGIRLSFDQAEMEYSQEMTGRVLFVEMRPDFGVRTSIK